MEVNERGDLADWMIPGKMMKGMGGAMEPRRWRQAGRGGHGTHREGTTETPPQVHSQFFFAIDTIGGTGKTLIELAEGVSLDEIKDKIEASFKVAPDLKFIAA